MITAAQIVGQVTLLGATEAEGKLLTLGAATDAQSARFRMLAGIGASVLVAGLVAVGFASAKMAGDFGQAVNRLNTGAGDVTDSFATLSSGILKVSVATGVLSGPLTKAMYEILSSGQRGAQAFDTLAAAAKGAVIEQANVVDVSDTLSGTMTNFGTKVFGAVAYMNGLIMAVSRGRITLQDLSTAMGPIEPVAHAMGISFADLAAAMSTQTNAAIPAARAATGLRFMMQALEVPTKKAKDAMTEWGLSSVAVADEMKVSLPGALQMIYDAAKKAGPEGSVPFNRAISDMVGGQRSLATFLALTGGHMKAFKDNAAAIAASMRGGAGDVAGWALAQTNFNVIWDKTVALLQAGAIKLGLLLLPALGQLLSIVPTVVGYLSDFSSHANVLVPILAGIGAVLVGLLVPAIWSLAAGVIAATWPVLLIGAAIAGLVAIFMHFYSTNAGFKTFIDQLVVGFKQVASYVIANFIPAMKMVGAWLATYVLPILQQIGGFLVSTFAPVWKQLVDVWNGSLLPSLKQLWAALVPLQPVLQALGGLILAVVIVALALLVGMLKGTVQALAGFLSGLAIAVGGAVQLFTGFVQVLSGVVRFIYDLLTGNFGKLKADLATIWAGIANIFLGTWNIIKGIFLAAWGAISGYVSGLVSGVIGFFQHLAAVLVGHSIVPDMINAIVGWFLGLPGRVMGAIGGLAGQMLGFFGGLASQAASSAAGLVNNVAYWFSQLPGRAAGAMGALASMVLGSLANLAGRAASAGANIVWSIAGGILNNIGSAIGGAMNAVGNFISSHLPHSPAKIGPLRDLAAQGSMISEQIAAGMLSGMPKISAAMTGLLKPVSVGVTASANYSGLAYGGGAGRAPTIVNNITINPEVSLDGVRLSRQLMPHIARAIQTATGVK